MSLSINFHLLSVTRGTRTRAAKYRSAITIGSASMWETKRVCAPDAKLHRRIFPGYRHWGKPSIH